MRVNDYMNKTIAEIEEEIVDELVFLKAGRISMNILLSLEKN